MTPGPGGPRSRAPGLDALLARGESQRVEFKRTLPTREERVARLLAALANAGGGTVVVGVDDSGSPVGLADPAATAAAVAAIAGAWLIPRPSLETEVAPSDAGDVLLIRVGAVKDGPVRSGYAPTAPPYLRVNDRNVPLARGRDVLEAAAARGGVPVADRIAGLDRRVRERVVNVLRHARRFSAPEYAARCNVSVRTARRDIHVLTGHFLAVEVHPGVYEVPED